MIAAATAAAAGHRLGRELASGRAADRAAVAGPRGNGAAESVAWLAIPLPEATFELPDGSPTSLDVHRGKIILLNFWGSWCPPCLVEIPHLVRVQETLEQLGGTVIGPAIDSGSGEEVEEFARARGINYPVWLSRFEVSVGLFGAAGYPYTVLIDRDGIIRKRYLGPQTEETLLRDIGTLLTNPPPPPEREGVSG